MERLGLHPTLLLYLLTVKTGPVHVEAGRLALVPVEAIIGEDAAVTHCHAKLTNFSRVSQ